jgi:two-component system response regulator FixJ
MATMTSPYAANTQDTNRASSGAPMAWSTQGGAPARAPEAAALAGSVSAMPGALMHGRSLAAAPRTEASRSVHVVEGVGEGRSDVCALLAQEGYQVTVHASAEECLAALSHGTPACLVVETRLPRMSGLDLEKEITRRGLTVPVIFVATSPDVPTAVQAMKAGAWDFLVRPFDGRVLLEAVAAAVAKADGGRGELIALDTALEKLSQREKEVLDLALTGLSNKDIAQRLGISHRTVEVHRAHVIHKTGARRLDDLAKRLAAAGRANGLASSSA